MKMIRAVTSASNMFRRELCPGSAAAEADLRPEVDEDSEDSLEGTTLHALAADPSLDRSHLNGEQLDVLRLAAEGDEQIFALIHEAKGMPGDEPYQEWHEREFWLNRGIKKLFPGHCDRLRYYPRLKLLVVIDYKFGRREVVSAEANVQLRAYGVMAARDLDVNHSFVAINQPRLPFDQRLTVGEYLRETTMVDAKAHLFRIWDGSHDSKGLPRTDVPRVAGEDQCRYCAARLHCDAYRAKYAVLTGSAPDGAEAFVGRMRAMNDAELDAVWRAVGFAAVVADAAKTEIVRRKEAGGMAMYDLAPTGKQTKITAPAKAKAALVRLGLPEAEIDDRATHSLERLSELYRLRTGCTIKVAKKAIRDAVIDHCVVTEKAPSLKRREDYVALPVAAELEGAGA